VGGVRHPQHTQIPTGRDVTRREERERWQNEGEEKINMKTELKYCKHTGRSGNRNARKETLKEGDREFILRKCDEREESTSI